MKCFFLLFLTPVATPRTQFSTGICGVSSKWTQALLRRKLQQGCVAELCRYETLLWCRVRVHYPEKNTSVKWEKVWSLHGALETGCRVGLVQRHPPERVLSEQATPRMCLTMPLDVWAWNSLDSRRGLDRTAGALRCVPATAWCTAGRFSIIAFDFPRSNVFVML